LTSAALGVRGVRGVPGGPVATELFLDPGPPPALTTLGGAATELLREPVSAAAGGAAAELFREPVDLTLTTLRGVPGVGPTSPFTTGSSTVTFKTTRNGQQYTNGCLILARGFIFMPFLVFFLFLALFIYLLIIAFISNEKCSTINIWLLI
jgi:hypothetical protein